MKNSESKKSKQKHGVRTKLNSGDKKVKASLRKGSSSKSNEKINPTAETASKSLPNMQLITDANWVGDNELNVLNVINSVGSERSLSDNKLVPVADLEQLPQVVSDNNGHKIVDKPVKRKNTKKDLKIVEKPKNKYKRKEKNNNLLKDLKTSIVSGMDSIKVDYSQLEHIKAELHESAVGVKASFDTGIEKVKNYAKTVKSETVNSAKKLDLKKLADENNKLSANKNEDIQKPIVDEDKKSVDNNKTESVTKEELKKAAEISSKSVEPQLDTETLHKLNQAIQRRDGTLNAINALKAQLEYTPKHKQKTIKDRIKQKESQLAAAEKIIADLQN